jgi:hypothetical protein
MAGVHTPPATQDGDEEARYRQVLSPFNPRVPLTPLGAFIKRLVREWARPSPFVAGHPDSCAKMKVTPEHSAAVTGHRCARFRLDQPQIVYVVTLNGNVIN